MSLFRRALVPFHGFSVLVSTRGFKPASLKFDSALGTRGFKSELWHTCSVLACLFRLSYVTCVACLFGLMALRTSYVTCTCVPCLFRLVALRTSYVICVACLSWLIPLRTSYLTSVACLFLLMVLRTSYVTCGVLDSTCRLMLHVKHGSLDLGLRERIMLHLQYACFDSWHD